MSFLFLNIHVLTRTRTLQLELTGEPYWPLMAGSRRKASQLAYKSASSELVHAASTTCEERGGRGKKGGAG